jgi:WD40 repeat protein
MRPLILAVAAAALATPALRAQERLLLQERSPGPAVALRYAPDGSRLAVSFQNDQSVRVYPAAGGEPAVIPTGLAGDRFPRFTPDGAALVCATAQGVKVFDATTGKERRALTEPGEDGSFAVSPDGRTLAVAGADGSLRLFDFATLRERQLLQRGTQAILTLALSGDGHTLATVQVPGVVRVRKDGKDWDRLDLAAGAKNQVWRLTFSPDGAVLAVGNSGRTVLRDLAGRKSLGEIPSEIVAFTPDGGAVAAVEGDGVRLRDLTGRPLGAAAPAGGDKPVAQVHPAAAGRAVVLLLTDGEVVLREVADPARPGGRSVVLRKGGAPAPLALTPDGRTALVADADGRLHFHDADARSETFGKELAAEAPAPAGKLTALAVSPDGRRAAAVRDGAARLWDVAARRETGGDLALPPQATTYHFSADGGVFTAAGPGGIRRWRAATGERLGPAHPEPALAAALLAWPAAGGTPADLAAAVAAGEVLRRLDSGHEGAEPLAAPVLAGGDVLATLSPRGLLRLIDLPTGKETELQRPVQPIYAVEFTPDGRLLATLRSDGSLELWDAATGRPTGETTPPVQLLNAPALLFSPDGRRALVYGWNTIGVLDRTTGKFMPLELAAGGGFSRPHFSADGTTVTAEGHFYPRPSRSWSVATGRLLPPRTEGGTGRPAGALAAAPDGKHVAAALTDGSVLVWDVSRPADPPQADRGPAASQVKELRFSPDGKLLAAACFNGEIRLWDAAGKPLKVLKHHPRTSRVADIVFSPDSKLLVAEASDSSGSLWDVDPSSPNFGKLRAALPDLKAVHELGLRVWSPDGKLLAVLTTDRRPRTIDAATGATRQELPEHGANVEQMAFAADGRTLLVRTAVGRVYAWDGMTGKEVGFPAALPATADTLVGSAGGWVALATATRVVLWRGPGDKAPVELTAPNRAGAVAFSADGTTVATGGASLRLWRLADGAWKPVELPRQPEGGRFALLDVSSDGRAVLVQPAGRPDILYGEVGAGKWARVGSAGGAATPPVRLVPGKPLALVRVAAGSLSLGNPLEGPMTRIHSAATQVTAALASPDGKTAVTGSADGSLRWYADGDMSRPRYTVDAHAGPVTRLALSPDGKRLLSAGGTDQMSLWDCSGEPRLLRSDSLRNASTVAWSPDGARVAVGSEQGEVRQWDAGGPGRQALQPAVLRLSSLALSHDGRTLAALDELNTARVHDTTGQGALLTLAGVVGLALSPDGKWLATADTVGTVRLYEARTGKERGAQPSLPLAGPGPNALAFSPDSRTLSVACRDNFVRHWDLAANAEGARFPWCPQLLFSGDGRWRVGVTAGAVTVWDAATGQEKGHWAGSGQVSVSADGQVILLHNYNSPLRLIDVAAGGEPAVIFKEVANQVNGATLTPDGRTVIATTYDARVRFWDRPRGAERAAGRPRGAAPGGTSPLVVSQDGRWLMFADTTGGLRVWDVAAARERVVLTAPGTNSFVNQFQLSGDGSTLVASYYDGSVRVFDARLAAERPPLTGHAGPVTAVALSADGKRAASAGEDRTVRVYDPAAPARAFAVLRGSRTPLLGVAISPDGRTVAAAAADGQVYLWPSDTRDELRTIKSDSGWTVRVRYLPGGKRALSSGFALRVWDLAKGEEVRMFAQGATNHQFDVTADGKRCASADGTSVREWDIDGQKAVREFKGLTDRTVWVVLYLPGDKEVLAASGDGRTLVWDRATGKLAREFEKPGGFARCGAFSPDGKWLATGDGHTNYRRDAIRLWDPATGKVVRGFGDYSGEVCFVAWSPDGKRLAAAGADATLRVFDPETGKELRRVRQPTWADSVAWTPDGKRLLSTGNNGDNNVHLWDVESGKELHTFAGHQQPAITVAVAPDGRTALSAGKDGTLRQWNLAPAEPVVLKGHEGEAWAVAFSPDGKLLATAGADRTVRLWDVSGDRERPGYGKPVRTLGGAAQGLLAVAFSPDGKLLAAGEGDPFLPRPGAVRLWDVETGELTATLRGHTGAVRAVAFASDGKRLASGGGDATVRLWDPRDGSARGAWHGHKTAVTGLAFDRDGTLLASSGAHLTAPAEPGEVLLWDVAAGRQRGPLVGHAAGLTGVAIAPDGGALYASAYDETVRVWSLQRPAP